MRLVAIPKPSVPLSALPFRCLASTAEPMPIYYSPFQSYPTRSSSIPAQIASSQICAISSRSSAVPFRIYATQSPFVSSQCGANQINAFPFPLNSYQSFSLSMPSVSHRRYSDAVLMKAVPSLRRLPSRNPSYHRSRRSHCRSRPALPTQSVPCRSCATVSAPGTARSQATRALPAAVPHARPEP